MTTFDDGRGTPLVPDAPEAAGNRTLTDTMLAHLKAASPWLRFLGIVGFIGAGLTALVGLIVLVFHGDIGMLSGTMTGYPFDFLRSSLRMMGFPYIVAGVIQFFPALFTYRFGDWIRRHGQTGDSAHLETALKNNESLWKFQGIVAIVGLALIPIIVVCAVIIAVIGFRGLF